MPDTIRLLHITDTHLFADPAAHLRGVVTHESLAAVLAAACAQSHWPPAAILATGDLSEDESPEAYIAFAELLSAANVPVHCLPGNHDDPAHMSELLSGAPFTLCATPTFGRWLLIMLSSHMAGSPAGRLGEQEMARLEHALAQHPEYHVLICLHHQPLPMGSRWLDQHLLQDAEPFHRLVAAHRQVRGVLWGHVHQNSQRESNGVLWLSTPSTCAQFLPGSDHFALDTQPPAWRWLMLHDDGTIDAELCWLQT